MEWDLFPSSGEKVEKCLPRWVCLERVTQLVDWEWVLKQVYMIFLKIYVSIALNMLNVFFSITSSLLLNLFWFMD